MIRPTVFAEATAIPATDTNVFSATGSLKMIDKFVVRNSDTVPRDVTIYVVPPGGSAAAGNIRVVKTLLVGETYTFPEIVGRNLAPNSFIVWKASAASVCIGDVSGREVS